MDQLTLSTELDNILPLLSAVNGECGNVMSKLLCHYYFAPCGANDQLHLPVAVCQDECHYVQTVCNKQWGVVNHLLSAAGLSNVSCNATGTLLQGLAPCCIDAGIQIKGKTPIEKYDISHDQYFINKSFHRDQYYHRKESCNRKGSSHREFRYGCLNVHCHIY